MKKIVKFTELIFSVESAQDSNSESSSTTESEDDSSTQISRTQDSRTDTYYSD